MTQQLMDDVFGVPMSVGTISQLEQATTAAGAAPVEEARTYVHEQAVAHLDETSWRQGGTRAWLWVRGDELGDRVCGAAVPQWRRGPRAAGGDVCRYRGDGSLQCLQLVSGAVASAVLGASATGFRSDA